MKPDANNRATTKDILRHDWLAHGPVLSIRLNPTTTTTSSLSLSDQQSYNDYEKIRLQTLPTTVENSLSPSNSLVELELHTSSFFDTARLRNNSSINKEQQRRNRVSAIPISTRYLSSNNNNNNDNNTKTNSSLSTSRPTYRRPVSLSLDDQHSTSETSQTQSVATRHSRRTISPASTTTTYGNSDRFHSPHRYTLATSSELTTTTKTPSRYLVSYDLDSALNDVKRTSIYKYTPSTIESNVVPSLPSSTTTVAPSVFTTSAIKFAPAPIRRTSPIIDQELNSSSSTARLLNNTISNLSSNINDSINPTSTTTTNNNRRSSLTSFELSPSTTNDTYHNRLLDDNNNFVALKVYEQE